MLISPEKIVIEKSLRLDFSTLVAKFTEPPLEELKLAGNMDGKSIDTISQQGPSPWEVYVDGASN